jgi:hypothetical protein
MYYINEIWLKIGISFGAVVNKVMKFRFPNYVGNFLSNCTNIGLSRRTMFDGVYGRISVELNSSMG